MAANKLSCDISFQSYINSFTKHDETFTHLIVWGKYNFEENLKKAGKKENYRALSLMNIDKETQTQANQT